ncbi:MAG: glycosyltransferase family 4 protein [Candidatus Saccharimonadales bacterium]
MKIGLVCPYNLFRGGGVQECVLAVQAELNKRGHDAIIVTPKPRENHTEEPKGVRLLGRATDMKSPFHTTAQVSVSVDPNEVDSLLEQENFDVLHFHEPWVPLLSRQILLKSNARNIATFHAKLPDTVMSQTIKRVITPYTKSVLKYIDVFTAVSDPASAYLRALSDVPITIVPNGIDLAKYRIGKPSKSPYVFYIGRLERRKGIKFLLNAMAKLQLTYPDIKLILAGDGSDRAQLERYAKDNKINAEFLGRIDEATKLKLLREAHVFCSPARYGESFGIVLLEAMASGVPIVAGCNPGYETVLTGTGRLSLVDPSDTSEFTRRLDLMLHDEAVRGIWKDWAKANIDQYDYKMVVDQYVRLYEAA